MAVFVLQNGRVVYANPFCLKRSGFSFEDLQQMDPTEPIHPDSREAVRQAIRDLEAGKADSFRSEMRIFNRDGSEMWGDVSLSPVPWEGRSAVLVVSADITSSRRSDEVMNSMWLTLSTIRERERERLAAALHDSAGQMLSAGLFKLAALDEMVCDPQARDLLADTRSVLRQVAKDLRTLTFELTPPILSDYGLGPALKWLSEQFTRQYGMKFSLRTRTDFSDVHDRICVALFWSVREVLTNIVKHAEAGRTYITTGRKQTERYVRIRDDGIGFNVERAHPAPDGSSGWGLFSIRRRMQQVGGEVRIDSAPRRGTTVMLSVWNGTQDASTPVSAG